ncbi:chorismate-binding protein [Allomuricauda sp. SCSIO 65647]|uniref:chorismate-binding protein n=1 Tax=Allomuricauda sp. SCSIO 65647 TaxID=2908843 RepID=UPI001F2F28EA|nr:chorismate-binding protein [Muricauda sp. SCSIO 65647]UJH67122.1 chorismate-binding protein [Muricauda sp. SCSIO 65647]
MLYQKSSFSYLLKKAAQQYGSGLPFVLYRKPRDKQIRAIFQKDAALNIVDDFQESGFVFAPFDTKKPTVLLKPDTLFSAIFSSNNYAGENIHNMANEDTSAKKKYLEAVNNGIAEIKKGALQKVVFSRQLEVSTRQLPFSIFERALQKYPSAFCYLFYHAKVGMWLGATPERLLVVEDDTVKTVSLAGTSAAPEPVWSDKEREEQQMVTDFIFSALNDITVSLTRSSVENVRAGKLWHLKTDIMGHLQEETPLKEIVLALHPTPAVCGLPRDKAKQVIEGTEHHDREYYTGYLGELNIIKNKTADLYVNLRCMQLKPDRATLYVGGGVTGASDPESEWQETQGKSQTMLGLL